MVIIEREDVLLGRASLVNQARVHHGYHYPRSFVTAVRSAANFPRFALDFRHAVISDFSKVYAIARENSKVNAGQFYQFCRKIGAPIEEAQKKYASLFEAGSVEGIFSVKEFAFDAVRLREALLRRLRKEGVEIRFRTSAERIFQTREGNLSVVLEGGGSVDGGIVFAAAYAQLNVLLRASGLPPLPMKHEVTEVALVRHAPPLSGMGITVMDGPFFSTMPFPSRQAHSFTHVRYTPQGNWDDTQTPADPTRVLRDSQRKTACPQMMRDAIRFIPALRNSVHIGSLYEIKTVLLQNEDNDGRPILFRNDYSGLRGFGVVMGGKIDNIYDILAALGGLRDGAKALAPSGENWISRLFRGNDEQ